MKNVILFMAGNEKIDFYQNGMHYYINVYLVPLGVSRDYRVEDLKLVNSFYYVDFCTEEYCSEEDYDLNDEFNYELLSTEEKLKIEDEIYVDIHKRICNFIYEDYYIDDNFVTDSEGRVYDRICARFE